MFKNPFIPVMPVHDNTFVDREEELNTTLSWLSSGYGSLVITGERGIGKSSLILKVVDLARTDLSNTHILFTSVYRFHSKSFDLLLPELALEICISIWQELFGRRYSELFEDSLPVAGLTIEKKDIKAIKRIYNILKAASISAKASSFRSLGGKLVVEGKLQETQEREVSRQSLTVYEFLALIDELKIISESYGRSRIVIIADEFNYLNTSEQHGFVQDFFEVLNSRKIQFALVGVTLDPNIVPGFRQCIETSVQLGPFSSSEYTKELITLAISSSSDFEFFDINSITDTDCERIHIYAKGDPRLIQELCYHLFDEVYMDRATRLTTERIDKIARIVESRQRELELRLRVNEQS